MDTIAKRLTALRSESRLSLREVERHSAGALSNVTVSEIERGSVINPRVSTIAELARIFCVRAGWLAFGEGEKK